MKNMYRKYLFRELNNNNAKYCTTSAITYGGFEVN